MPFNLKKISHGLRIACEGIGLRKTRGYTLRDGRAEDFYLEVGPDIERRIGDSKSTIYVVDDGAIYGAVMLGAYLSKDESARPRLQTLGVNGSSLQERLQAMDKALYTNAFLVFVDEEEDSEAQNAISKRVGEILPVARDAVYATVSPPRMYRLPLESVTEVNLVRYLDQNGRRLMRSLGSSEEVVVISIKRESEDSPSLLYAARLLEFLSTHDVRATMMEFGGGVPFYRKLVEGKVGIVVDDAILSGAQIDENVKRSLRRKKLDANMGGMFILTSDGVKDIDLMGD